MFARKSEAINALRVPAKKGGKYEQYLKKLEEKREKQDRLHYIQTWRDIPLNTCLVVSAFVFLYLFLTSYTFVEYVAKKIVEYRQTEDEL